MKIEPELWKCKHFGYLNDELKCTLYRRYCYRACSEHQEEAGTDFEVYGEDDQP